MLLLLIYMIDKDILQLSFSMHVSYANALSEVERLIDSNVAADKEEAILILKRIHTDESEGHKTADGVSAII